MDCHLYHLKEQMLRYMHLLFYFLQNVLNLHQLSSKLRAANVLLFL